MTAQIAEKFKFEGQDYRLLCAGGSADAAQDGLAAAGLDFDLAGAGLAPVPEEEIIRLEFGVEQGRVLVKRRYTARLLLCRGLLHRYYSEAPWSYQESLELAFEDGVLRESADAQPVVRAARELLFAPEKQDDLYALADGHWWLSRCLGLSGSPQNAPKIAADRQKGEHF